jgi:hypothetical protein
MLLNCFSLFTPLKFKNYCPLLGGLLGLQAKYFPSGVLLHVPSTVSPLGVVTEQLSFCDLFSQAEIASWGGVRFSPWGLFSCADAKLNANRAKSVTVFFIVSPLLFDKKV